MASATKTLPPNEAHQLVQLITQVEQRKWPKAVKTADGILKKYPNHGESLSLKALARHAEGHREEAYQLARKGLKNDICSVICLGAMASLYKDDHVYRQALKYLHAGLQIDPKNEKILRDMADIQLHLRDYEAHYSTRLQLLKLRSDLRINWIGYAVAAHLCNDHKFAAHITTNYRDSTLKDPSNEVDKWELQFEQNEMLIYRNFILRDSGDYEAAYNDLISIKPCILDKIHWQELHGELLLLTKRFDEAKQQFFDLIKINPDNVAYHSGLIHAHQIPLNIENGLQALQNQKNKTEMQKLQNEMQKLDLNAQNISTLNQLYDQLEKEHPKSSVIKQLPLLYWSTGEEFEIRFERFVKPLLTKGVPSLFNSLKPLYKNENHVKTIEKFLVAAEESLAAKSEWPASKSTSTGSDDAKADTSASKEPPTTYMWVLFFLAQHYNKLFEFEKAFEKINLAIEHSPTVIDLYLVKGRIYKTCGDFKKAAECVEKARTMDLADRYLNTKSVHYWLLADQVEKANENLAIFTKLDASNYNNAYSMQVMWYENDLGKANLRLGKMNNACKAFMNTIEHFDEIYQDQFDFFHYSVRKMTISSYIKMMRMENHIKEQTFFKSAAQGLIKAYIRLNEQLNGKEASASLKTTSEQDLMAFEFFGDFASQLSNDASSSSQNNVPVADKKSGAPKKKPAAAVQEKLPKPWNNKYDRDPHGDIIASTKRPLTLALKLADELQRSDPSDLESQLACFQLYLKVGKPLLALRSLKQMLHIINNDSQLNQSIHSFNKAHYQAKANFSIVLFANQWKTSKTSDEPLNQIVDDELSKLLQGAKTVEEFNKDWKAKAKLQVEKLYLSASLIISGNNPSEVKDLLLDVGKDKHYSVEALVKANFLICKHFGASESEKFKATVHSTYPYIGYFVPQSTETKVEEQKEIVEPTNE